MANLLHKRFPFPDYCSVQSIVMRETNGIDEQHAAIAAEAAGASTSLYQELIKLSIVEVNDQRVIQPFNELSGWNSKTRQLVTQGFDDLNQLKDEDLAAFLGASEDVTPGLAPVEKPVTAEEASASTGG